MRIACLLPVSLLTVACNPVTRVTDGATDGSADGGDETGEDGGETADGADEPCPLGGVVLLHDDFEGEGTTLGEPYDPARLCDAWLVSGLDSTSYGGDQGNTWLDVETGYLVEDNLADGFHQYCDVGEGFTTLHLGYRLRFDRRPASGDGVLPGLGVRGVEPQSCDLPRPQSAVRPGWQGGDWGNFIEQLSREFAGCGSLVDPASTPIEPGEWMEVVVSVTAEPDGQVRYTLRVDGQQVDEAVSEEWPSGQSPDVLDFGVGSDWIILSAAVVSVDDVLVCGE